MQVPGATKAAPAIAQVLDQGKELESQRCWAEAYALYDDTNRLNPGQTEVESRLDVAKMHFDVGRRYADSSFRRTVSSLSETDALELYTDAANKLQSHYVQVPDWANLVNRGTSDLEIALADQTFLETNIGQINPDRVNLYLRELRKQDAAPDSFAERCPQCRVERSANGAVAPDNEAGGHDDGIHRCHVGRIG